MIDISCKFYLRKLHDIYIVYQLVGDINRHQKFLLICTELPTVALPYHIKIRENY